MVGLYDLSPGPPRSLGQTRNNQYSSLHGASLRDRKSQQTEKSRRPSLPISAPPRGSSSDEDCDAQEPSDDGASNDSEIGRIKRTGKIQADEMPRMGTCLRSATERGGKNRELSLEPSNIPSSNFTSGKDPKSRNGSQSSQKRGSADLDDDDDIPMSFSQSKRLRQSYGCGVANIHKGPVTKPGKAKKVAPKQNEKAKSAFKAPKTDAMLARVDKIGSKSEGTKKRRRWEAPPTQTSPRSQRVSQRSAKNIQISSQSSSKSFKQPPQPSPKKAPPHPPPRKAPNFRVNPMMREEMERPPARKCSTSSSRPAVPAEASALKSSELQGAFNTATNKLGISDVQFRLPPSGPQDSSAPLDAATTDSSPLSSLDDSTLGSSQDVPIITSEDIPNYQAMSRPAACPMCKQPVDQSYLEQFTEAGKRMSLRQQALFCKAHKERSAESEWAEREYPKIDWQQLDARIVKLHGTIDDILSQRKPSFYRNVFEDSLKSGKNKTIQESLMGGDEIEGTLPGYYGGRGAKLMVDNIMSRFARKIRRLAASDKLISSGGVSRYVQAVLVPEMAVLLVMGDMNVDEEKAREILRDSVDIGNLLNEEEDETITDLAPEERAVSG